MKGIKLSDYEETAGSAVIEEIMALGERLRGYSILHINSTAVGGGVVEILHSLVPLMREAGLDAAWSVLKGTAEFFHVTKLFHNGLHGQPVSITGEMLKAYSEVTHNNREIIAGMPTALFCTTSSPWG